MTYLEVLDMLVGDMEQDVKDFTGRPFDGKTLGELHGNLAAAIVALAKILRKQVEILNIIAKDITDEQDKQ